MVLSGTLGNLLDAFPADLQLYPHPPGTYRGRRGEILVPEELAAVIKGIVGFDSRPRRRSRAMTSLSGDVVWNDGTAFDPTDRDDGGGWATGGGVSKLYPVPDLSMNAVHYLSAVDGGMTVVGGTSAVAPLMAGLIARFNQALSIRHKKAVGYMNPFLYAHATDGRLASVLSGNNGIANFVAGYQAGPDWNACCGLGTPDGTAMLDSLLSL